MKHRSHFDTQAPSVQLWARWGGLHAIGAAGGSTILTFRILSHIRSVHGAWKG